VSERARELDLTAHSQSAGGPALAPGKRLLDIVAGTALAIVSAPIIAALAVAVCVSLRTWRPFFLQRRIGWRGRPFTLPKLRTLPPQTPGTLDKYALSAVHTTRLGRFLRRTHLDELPQLLLVPVGRMSLVGPRPEMPSLLTRFDPSFVAARSQARPGCTGLWQIGTDAGRLIGEAPEYDLYYLRRMSARLDLWVMWRSLLVMAGGAPVSLDQVPASAQRRGNAHDEPRTPSSIPASRDPGSTRAPGVTAGASLFGATAAGGPGRTRSDRAAAPR
jgi:lipopolysaccharide/colanic/teichoic acid biosynthesis glycosyltransferase